VIGAAAKREAERALVGAIPCVTLDGDWVHVASSP
jgi:hypothetical protein